jgi:hypothetical protein
VNNFVTERNSAEVMAVGLNAVRYVKIKAFFSITGWLCIAVFRPLKVSLYTRLFTGVMQGTVRPDPAGHV